MQIWYIWKNREIEWHKFWKRPGSGAFFELGYFIDKVKKDVQDPLSVMLSISDEMDDERVETSVNEMIEEYVW